MDAVRLYLEKTKSEINEIDMRMKKGDGNRDELRRERWRLLFLLERYRRAAEMGRSISSC